MELNTNYVGGCFSAGSVMVDYNVELTLPETEAQDSDSVARQLEDVLISAVNDNEVDFDIDTGSVTAEGLIKMILQHCYIKTYSD